MTRDVTLIIGTKRFSSWSLRPWLAAKMAGLNVTEIEITLRQPDTKANILVHSPSGKVPCLIHDGLVVWDSLAICEYLAETFPEAGLWPTDPAARAVARAVSAEMHSGFVALRNACSMDMCAHIPMTELADDLATDIHRINVIWEDCRARFGDGGPFLFGEFSVADAMFAPVVSRFTTYDLPVNDVGRAYCQAVWDLAPMQEWKAASV
ncbi:MAG: glutathione S-transferase family protein [Magnetospirillum sp.]